MSFTDSVIKFFQFDFEHGFLYIKITA